MIRCRKCRDMAVLRFHGVPHCAPCLDAALQAQVAEADRQDKPWPEGSYVQGNYAEAHAQMLRTAGRAR